MSFLKFIGQVGEHLTAPNGYGIPGRDLSQADVDSLDPEAKATLEHHIANHATPIFAEQDGEVPEHDPAQGIPQPETEVDAGVLPTEASAPLNATPTLPVPEPSVAPVVDKPVEVTPET